MKKKLLALLLGMSMTAGLLAGCGGSSAPAASSSSTEKSEGESGDAADPAEESSEAPEEEPVEEIKETPAEAAIRERKESGELPTVTMAFLTFAGEPAGLDRVEQAISTYTEETLGLKVDLLVTDFASYSTTVKDLLENGGKVDLFSTVGLGYQPAMKAGYLKNLEENDLLAEYGADIPSAVEEKYLTACREADGIYTIPSNRDLASGRGGVAVDKECLDLAGVDYQSMYTYPDVDVIFLAGDEMTDILKKVQEACPDRRILSSDYGFSNLMSDGDVTLGGDNYGVLAEDGSLTVVNPLDTEGVVSFAKRIREWKDLGFYEGELEESLNSEAVKNGKLAAYVLSGVSGVSKSAVSVQCGKEMIIFQCGKTCVSSNAPASMGWSMNRNCEDPVAAMQLLNACYTDPVLANLLCWGEEGTDYQLTEDGHAAFPEGVDASNAEYYLNVNWLMPNQFITHVWEGNPIDMWDRVKAYESLAEENPALGFYFDNSELAEEYGALTYDVPLYSLQDEYWSYEDAMNTIRQDMENAGIEKYMAAKQAALDEWAAARGLK